MKKIINWLVIIFAIFGLIGVRVLEDKIFYDPFLNYFRGINQQTHFPDFQWNKLILSHLFRFGLNLIFSAIIIQFMFKRRVWTLQAILMICLVFIITFPIYLYCVSTKFEIGHLFSFYMRRFVIQPLILLLIIPMFYYRLKMRNEGHGANQKI
ncbi:MAG: exosortase F system-associated protein [Flavobacteriaceae bacterium]|jgi:exosortase F-associated protein|nr:exosortase F system-associated protein [Flavobacteriaceae bacterium]